jgi:hypothetical protein
MTKKQEQELAALLSTPGLGFIAQESPYDLDKDLGMPTEVEIVERTVAATGRKFATLVFTLNKAKHSLPFHLSNNSEVKKAIKDEAFTEMSIGLFEATSEMRDRKTNEVIVPLGRKALKAYVKGVE